MKKVIVIISFIIAAVALVLFFSIDSCMDAGGRWDNMGLSCYGVGSEFVPQYQRAAPFFWLLVLFVAGVVSFIAHNVLPSEKP